MSVAERTVADPVRCASWSRDASVDPIGTAGFALAVVAVEVPLPWPPRIEEAPAVAPLVEAVAGTGVQVQALVPSVPPGPGVDSRPSRTTPTASPTPPLVRVALYRGADGPGYRLSETAVPAAQAVDGALSLLSADGAGADGAAPQASLSRRSEPPAQHVPGHGGHGFAGELLLCGHGRRDRCCGSMGTELALRLEAGPALHGPGGAYRVRRTSHTGGHRFAPTGILMPEGTLWAYLDTDVLARIVGRSGEVGDVLRHYRGYLRLPSPELQALEREVLGVVGWELFDAERWGERLDDGRFALHVRPPGEAPITWVASVDAGRTLPVPVCGAPIGEAVKQQTELVVGALDRLA